MAGSSVCYVGFGSGAESVQGAVGLDTLQRDDLLGDLLEGGGGGLSAVVKQLRIVEDHQDRVLRLVSREEAAERGDVLIRYIFPGLGVYLLGCAGFPGDRVAGYARVLAGTDVHHSYKDLFYSVGRVAGDGPPDDRRLVLEGCSAADACDAVNKAHFKKFPPVGQRGVGVYHLYRRSGYSVAVRANREIDRPVSFNPLQDTGGLAGEAKARECAEAEGPDIGIKIFQSQLQPYFSRAYI